MAFDPAQDPWGAALLVTAALSGVGLSVALVARGLGRPATFGGWVMGLGLVGFLGSAVAGAVVRVEAANTASAAEVEPDPSATPSEAEPAIAEDDVGPDDVKDDVADDHDDGDDPESAVAQGGEAIDETRPAKRESTASLVAPPPPLPTDPAERRSAVRIILRDGKRVAGSKNACTDMEQVANVWARIAAIPDDVWSTRGNVIVRKLDACRRKIGWTALYVVRHERTNARASFPSTLENRLQESGKSASVSVHERNHVRLRVGTQSISHEEFSGMLDGGLREELESLGFEKVTFSDGQRAETMQLDPVGDQAVANERLEPYGLVGRFSR